MKFSYHVHTPKGALESGTIEAPNREAAIDALRRGNLVIIDIGEATEAPVLSRSIKLWRRGVPRKEVVLFSRQIATLFEAKVSLLEALKTMVDQTQNPTFKEALLDVVREVDAGSPLSKALGLHTNVFSEFYVNMVKSGETSGKLEEVFGYLADGLERELYLMQKVKGAMTYPAFIIFGFTAVMFVMMIVVVPNLTSVLKDSGAALPPLTVAVIALSEAFKAYWWAMILGMIAAAGGIWYFLKSRIGKAWWDRISLKLPLFGNMFTKFYLARMADSLSVLIRGGLPIVQVLEVTADVVRNTVYKGILFDTAEQVKKGSTISSVFKQRKEIPIMITQMVFVGEESGKLDSTLKAAADFYNKEVTVMMDNLVTLIEPVLILLLGAGVAILMISILVPMYNVAQSF